MKATYALLRTSLSANVGLVLCGLASLAIWLVALYGSSAIGRAADGFNVMRAGIDGGGPAWPLLLLFVPYVIGYRYAVRCAAPGAVPVVVAFSVLFCGALIAKVVPTASHDIYLYIFQGRTFTVHGLNPYAIFPGEVVDPFVSSMGPWLAGLKNTYGPLWTSIAIAVTVAVGDRPVALLVAFKALAAAFFLGAIPLLSGLYSAVSKDRPRPGDRNGLLLLFAWNPALLFEFAGNGHNDSVMIFFLLLALLLAVRGHLMPAGVALAGSFLTKYITLLCLPFLIAYAVSRAASERRGRVAAATAVLAPAVAVSVLAFAPYWMGPATLDGLAQQASHVAVDVSSPLAFALALAYGGWERLFTPATSDFAAAASAVIFEVTMLALVIAAFARPMGKRDLVRFAFAPIACYLTIASFWFMPWYLSWITPVLLLEGAVVAAVVASAAGLLLYYTHFTGPVIGAAMVVVAVVPAIAVQARRGLAVLRRNASGG